MNTIRYLLGLFRAFPGTVASYFMSSQLGNIVAYLSGGYIARGFLNHLNGAPGPAFDLGPALVLLGLAQMVQLGTHVGWMYGSVRVSRFSMAMMSLNIMDRVLKRPGGLPLPVDRKKGRPLSEGQCLNTLSNDTIQLPGMFDFLFEVLSMLVSGVVAFWIMLRINSFVTLVVYLPLAFAFWLLNLLRKKVQPLADKARRSSGEVSTMIADMFNCIQTVKTSASEIGRASCRERV